MDLTPVDDAELVRRARDGDRDAFGQIIAIHQVAALRLATIISGDSTEAYDIVQEAFVRAYRALPSVRSSAAIAPWLMRVVANEAKNSRRGAWRRDRRHQRQAVLRPAVVAGPEDVALSDIDAGALMRAVGDLPERDRTIIACRFFAGMSEAETAAALDVAPGTVKSRTSRALDRLRDQLGDTMEVTS
jgi:RNA polymerase sigma factor (sigma-70 family)